MNWDFAPENVSFALEYRRFTWAVFYTKNACIMCFAGITKLTARLETTVYPVSLD